MKRLETPYGNFLIIDMRKESSVRGLFDYACGKPERYPGEYMTWDYGITFWRIPLEKCKIRLLDLDTGEVLEDVDYSKIASLCERKTVKEFDYINSFEYFINSYEYHYESAHMKLKLVLTPKEEFQSCTVALEHKYYISIVPEEKILPGLCCAFGDRVIDMKINLESLGKGKVRLHLNRTKCSEDCEYTLEEIRDIFEVVKREDLSYTYYAYKFNESYADCIALNGILLSDLCEYIGENPDKLEAMDVAMEREDESILLIPRSIYNAVAARQDEWAGLNCVPRICGPYELGVYMFSDEDYLDGNT